MIMEGFKNSITDQLVGIDSHISVKNFDSNSSYQSLPIKVAEDKLATLRSLPNVKSVSGYISKPAILKANNEIHGVVLKGIGSVYDTSFLHKSIIKGQLPDFSGKKKSNHVLVSEWVAQTLGLKVGDKLSAYFVQKPPRVRRFTVSGIYKTNLTKYYDEIIVIADSRHLTKLNKWQPQQVSGYEVRLHQIDQLPQTERQIKSTLPLFKEEGEALKVANLYDTYYGLFEWFKLIGNNVFLVIVICLFLAVFNIAASAIVMVMEQTRTIGTLKALGVRNGQIRRIFVLQSIKLLLKGMLYGNGLALVLSLVQKFTGVFTLNPNTYFVDRLPISYNFLHLAGLNLLVFVAIVLSLFIPTIIISRIRVSKTIKFD